MQLEEGHIFHIYNQGNNKQRIFFERENYLFFLRKMRTYLLPYCDVLAYCLMPNHFHWMVVVNKLQAKMEYSDTRGATPSRTPSSRVDTFQKSIGILLASYTRAINKQNNSSGALFRAKTKAECITKYESISRSYFNSKYGTSLRSDVPEKEYVQVCFNYIHQNPVVAGLVDKETEWEFSSAQDYAGIRNGTLVNKAIAENYVDF